MEIENINSFYPAGANFSIIFTMHDNTTNRVELTLSF